MARLPSSLLLSIENVPDEPDDFSCDLEDQEGCGENNDYCHCRSLPVVPRLFRSPPDLPGYF